MSEPAADPVAELRDELSALRGELADLVKANTPAERQEARADVNDAEADVIAAAKRAGLKPEQVTRALAEAKRAAFREEHGEEISAMIRTELEALMKEAEEKEAEAATENEVPDDEKPKAPKAKAEKPEKVEPEPDAAPERPHWSEKSIAEMLR